MPFKGVVKDNLVVLEKNARLKDGAHVIVVPEEDFTGNADFEADPFLTVDDWAPAPPADAPRDLAQKHDFYLYGTGK